VAHGFGESSTRPRTGASKFTPDDTASFKKNRRRFAIRQNGGGNFF
jgi:hypothetical protein